MEVRILGPLEVVQTDTPLALGGTKQRAVFAMLALRVNQVVSIDFLVEGLWGTEPPTDPTNAVQVYLSRLRKVLRPQRERCDQDGKVLRRTPGYLLQLDPEQLDLHRFERLTREGNDALVAAPELASAALSNALHLWRGLPLAEFTAEPFAQRETPRLEELRLNALTTRIKADLALGRHAQLVAELEELTAAHPMHEGLRGQLILSLYRSGRQSEALKAYRRARETLADELGIDPSRELRDLEAAVLAHAPHLDWTPPAAENTRAQPLRVSNLPPRNPHFTGRTDLIDQLHHELRTNQNTLIVQALYGLGGVGKTQLAIEYAHDNAAGYDIVWWIDAEQPVLIPDQLLGLATQLGLPTDAATAEVVNRVLIELGSRTRWLLIFDNAERPADVANFRPSGSGHVLVTSRYPAWGALGGRIEVDVLDRPDTVALLRSRIPDMSVELADRLAAELGDLPLAAAQAAGYLEQTGLPSPDYLRRFRTQRAGLLAAGDVLDYQGRVDTTWAISLERLRDTSPAAVALLEVSAFLAPEPIPLTVFTEHPELLDEPLRTFTAEDPDAIADAVGAMVGFSLARRHRDGFQLHRLLQTVIRNRIPPAHQDQRAATAVALLAAAYPGDPNEPATWASYARLAPHILDNGSLGDGHQGFRQILLRTITYLSDTGDPQAARSIADELLERWPRVLGPDHIDTLTAAAALTAALNWLGEHDQARVIGEDALRRARRELGPDHPVTLRLVNSKLVLTWFGPPAPGPGPESLDAEQATTMAEDTLQRALRTLGADHPITLGTSLLLITQKAMTLASQGDTATARAQCEDALRHSRNRLSPDHPTALGLTADLSLILVLEGSAEQAHNLAEETADRSRRWLGRDHYITLLARTVFAFVIALNGDAEQARVLAEDTLERCRDRLGSEHMITLGASAAVTISLARLGATEQAQTLGTEALENSRNRLGPNHPTTRILTQVLAPAQTSHLHNGHIS